jgi:hypothetical protein
MDGLIERNLFETTLLRLGCCCFDLAYGKFHVFVAWDSRGCSYPFLATHPSHIHSKARSTSHAELYENPVAQGRVAMIQSVLVGSERGMEKRLRPTTSCC